MIRRLSIQICLVTCLAYNCFSQNSDTSEKLRSLVRNFGQAEVVIPFTGHEAIDYLSRNVSIRSVNDKNVSIVLSPVTIEWFISGKFNYKITGPSTVKGIESSLNIEQAMDWNTYPTYRQYDSIMRFFAEEYPSLCILDTIGTTSEDRLVLTLKISDNCTIDEDEPEVFYTSSMHGDETGGYILMLRLSEHLLKNYNDDIRIRNLVDNLEIWINPLANPDGTYNNGDEIYMPVRGNAGGYDLNRNFPDPVVTGTILQKETIDMMKFMARHRFVLSANFHSGAELVNYPWDRWLRDHADKAWFYIVCRAYADTVHLYSPVGYMDYLDNGVTNGYRWYPVYGSRQDYMTWELNGREITIELDDDFVTPAYDLSELWENNRRSLLGYLENSLHGIHGRVIDAETGKPVPAKIFIEGHDKDNSQTYSDIITGRFVRLLKPGLWDLSFSAVNYRDTVVYGVPVTTAEKTDLVVIMKKNINRVDTTETDQPVLYPNPATSFIKAVLPRNIIGIINIKIYNLAGSVLSDYDTMAMEGIPVSLDIRALAKGAYIVMFTGKKSGVNYRSRFIISE